LTGGHSKLACRAEARQGEDWSAWGDLHSQGCSVLKRTGLLFPVNHTPVGNPGLAPGRLGDFKSPGSAIPAEASCREMVGMKGLAPPRLPDSESGPSAIRVEPHAREWRIRQGASARPPPPANSPFEAEDDHNFTTDAEASSEKTALQTFTLNCRSASKDDVWRRRDRNRFSNSARNAAPVQSSQARHTI
jgi:hypothetical protein